MTPRLWIEYTALALLLAIGGLAVTLKMQTYRQEISITNLSNGLEKEKDAREQLEAVNEAQDGVIQTLAHQRKTDNQAVTELLNTYQSLKDADAKLRDKLTNLEATDATAKAYLDALVPESVACMYDDSCPEAVSGGKDRVSKSTPPVSPIKDLLLAPEAKAKNSEGGYGKIPRNEGSGERVQGKP